MQNYDIATLVSVLSSSAIGLFVLVLAVISVLLPFIFLGTYRSNKRQEELLRQLGLRLDSIDSSLDAGPQNVDTTTA
mgnify:CR=1 FL=1